MLVHVRIERWGEPYSTEWFRPNVFQYWTEAKTAKQAIDEAPNFPGYVHAYAKASGEPYECTAPWKTKFERITFLRA